MKLFVGIGNPGTKYARHRHNVGFMAVERIAERQGFGPWRRRFQGHVADGELDGTKVLLLKPGTYMNESGRAVGEAARFLKLATSDIVVFHDELDLLPGKLKVKSGGGNAGHNGLRSITAHLDNEYARVRIGIGHPGAKELVQSWVLHDFARADETWLEPLLDAIADAAPRLAADDAARFLTDVARTLAEDADEEVVPKPRRQPVAEGSPGGKTAARHPTGERAGKRATALAENLKNWLAKRRPKD
jgi:PTH1 family peptidyl-tRNA hydrolase